MDADRLEEFLPAFRADVGEGAARREMAVRRVQMIDRRERDLAAEVPEALAALTRRHQLPDPRDVLHHVPAAVDDAPAAERCLHVSSPLKVSANGWPPRCQAKADTASSRRRRR